MKISQKLPLKNQPKTSINPEIAIGNDWLPYIKMEGKIATGEFSKESNWGEVETNPISKIPENEGDWYLFI